MAEPTKIPTKEDFEEQTKRAIEEAEALKDAPVEDEPEDAPVDETVDAPVDTPIEKEAVKDEPEEEEPEPSPDYKEKFTQSSREAQKVVAKNRVITKALADAEDIPEPTDEELIKEFTDWDVMSDTERMFAKETVVSRRWREKISEARQQASKIEKWNDAVVDFSEDPKTLVDNPELEGKGEAFVTFAQQEANNSVPFNVLVAAFLHEQSKGKKENKGRMFETGSGGPNDKGVPKTNKLSLEDARKLRETDYNKWRQALKEGRIETNL